MCKLILQIVVLNRELQQKLRVITFANAIPDGYSVALNVNIIALNIGCICIKITPKRH